MKRLQQREKLQQGMYNSTGKPFIIVMLLSQKSMECVGATLYNTMEKHEQNTIMNKTKFFFSLLLSASILVVQVGSVFAAPAIQADTPVGGTVQSITLETDPTTGVITVIMTLMDENQLSQSARVSLESAITLGLVALDGDGNAMINELALGQPFEVDPAFLIPDVEEEQHPVGNALATFFSDIAGLDYEAIMTAHDEGMGFGVIAQALWLTTKLEGNAEIFQSILQAKQTGDYSAFTVDGTTPSNWGQLKKAILNTDKKNGVGAVMSTPRNNENGNGNDKDKDNNRNENGNGKGNNEDKDKNKEKNK